VNVYQGTSADDVRERMEIVMGTRGEGLILKHPDGEYVLNGRNKDWIKVRWNIPRPPDLQLIFHPKVKPEYMVGITCLWWIGATIDHM